jgi:hypothetical protein
VQEKKKHQEEELNKNKEEEIRKKKVEEAKFIEEMTRIAVEAKYKSHKDLE